jgi:UDP-glucuronate 4-epimerase
LRALVTGCAGFIGSTLCDHLVSEGVVVTGVDSFSSYYHRDDKEANLSALQASGAGSFTLHEADLRTADLFPLVEGVDVIFHQAAQPGVRLSWSDGFEAYVTNNVLATQRLLEASVRASVPRFVYASSSSIYGQSPSYPTGEDDLPAPHSPYGVTKLAGEHLCRLYGANWGLSTVVLRYFTVYGPRQRPDMAIHRLIEAGLRGDAFPLYGDGRSMRDFTFVDDVVAANAAAATADIEPGAVMNIAGGGEIAMTDLIRLVEGCIERPITVDRRPPQAGDVARTAGRIERAHQLIGYAPSVSIAQGVERQAAWHRERSGT